MDHLEQFVPKVYFEKIPIKNLVSNQDYQRNLSQGHIEKAAENFDLYQINPVKVSRRDGVNYVFNGQHTIEIVALVSGSRDTPVWCMIYDELSYEHEADIFANQMKFVKGLHPLEVFNANLEAGNTTQLMIKELVESYGLTIGHSKGPCIIAAVSSLEEIYQKYGIHVLNRAIRILVGTWEGEASSLSGCFLKAVTQLIITYKDALDDEIFKDKVGAIPPKIIVRQAKERRPGVMGYVETMILAYNGKKKNLRERLSLKKLYDKEEQDEILDEEEDYAEYETLELIENDDSEEDEE